MAFVNIRNKIKSKLEAIDSIQEVQDFPTDEFGGFPAAMATSTRLEADFQTTTENKRTYVFTVYIIQEVKSQGERKARQIVEEVVDDVIEDFDKDQLLSGITLPSNEAIIISYPVLSSIYTGGEGRYVVGELEIKVVVQFDTEA